MRTKTIANVQPVLNVLKRGQSIHGKRGPRNGGDKEAIDSARASHYRQNDGKVFTERFLEHAR